MKKIVVAAFLVLAVACTQKPGAPLPRAAGGPQLDSAFASYLAEVKERGEELHSIMVIKGGKVLEEARFAPDTAHFMMSVSKTFTSTAVGFAISEGLLSLDDKIADIFPDELPEHVSDTLRRMTVRNLLTMNSGHGRDATQAVVNGNQYWRDYAPSGPASGRDEWAAAFLAFPLEHEPGTCYAYNSLGTYMLSAAVQRRSGQKVVDYLDTRLWQPLGIEHPKWFESPAGVNTGGWGLYLKTEDMARLGLCLLNGGKFGGRQVIPADWAREMGSYQVPSAPAGLTTIDVEERGMEKSTNDWLQGYGYQMWRNTRDGFRADGAAGQYILVLPSKDAVVVTTANIGNMPEELYLIWKHIFPAL